MTRIATSHPRARVTDAGSTRRLNLGCGARYHAAWTNVDTTPVDPAVLAVDVTRGLPFADASFDFVYHSHLLEHLTPEQAAPFLRECHRVLAPGGTVRVVVPDLEAIVRLYLQALDRARAGDEEWQHHYDWLLIELLDQTVRERTGGRHGTYLNRDDIPNVDFVIARHGQEARNSIEAQRAQRLASGGAGAETPPGRAFSPRAWVRPLRRAVGALRRRSLRELIAGSLLGPDRELLELGRFRRSGEIHQWMYDSYSLSRALVEAGFAHPTRMGAAESRMAEWAAFELDADEHGRPHKPDSLFVEAVKPRRSEGPQGP